MRKAFVKALCEEAKKNPKIFLITADLGFNVLEPFIEKFPKRFLNVGVAEANLISVAAGLSANGFMPFVYSIATFASMRPFEQIRNDISLQNRNVKIVAVGAGLAYNRAGPTHHSAEDIAIIRSLPNITIVNPADTLECYQATKLLARLDGPAYLRIERNPEDLQEPYTKPAFKIGKGQIIAKGKGVAILTTGTKIPTAFLIRKALGNLNVNPAIYSFPTIKPLDYNLLKSIASSFKTIITIEEHQTSGGFGGAVSEFISGPQNPHINKVLRFGLKDSPSLTSAQYDALMHHHSLTPKQIAKSIIKYRAC